MELDCFLLTRHWRDTAAGLEIELWCASGRGPVRLVFTGQEAVCFVARDTPLPERRLREHGARRRPLELRTLDGRPADALYFRSQHALAAARESLRAAGQRLHESDVHPVGRFLMERRITAGLRISGEPRARVGHLEFRDPALRAAACPVALRACSIDLESAGLDGPIWSLAALCGGERRCFLVGSARAPAVQSCAGEADAIRAFLAWIAERDPDLLIGWNVTGFDLALLERRCRALGVPFSLGRAGERAAVLPGGGARAALARVPGRVVLDGIELLRASFRSFESYELDTVARALLGRGKAIDDPADRLGEIHRLYREDPAALAAYNIEDCRLVDEIFRATGLIEFAMRRAGLTGLALDRLGGSVAALDHLYLPRLHRRGRVAGDADDAPGDGTSPGGYVLASRPGLHDNVLVLDFKSLYPSIIRTFHIDPWGLACPGEDPVPGFAGARFAREGAILPELIAELWGVRDQARARRDAALSQAVKILMNSFYGVLAAEGCRFRDPRLATSITRRGHQIIRASRLRIQGLGHPVLYGDTDSLFVHLGEGVSEEEARAAGERLAAELNAWWRRRIAERYRLESFLEVEFETHFLRFLMPTVRAGSAGSKKRYAGLVRTAAGGHEVVFKGLESVRGDWTPLARRFQRELYRRVFLGEPWEDYVRETLAGLMAGRLDAELVYRKRLRRPLDAYRTSVPPHVQAARKLADPGREVRYVVTRSGPEPVTGGRIPAPDHAHYRDRQLAPAADGILHFLGTRFAALADDQMDLF